MLRGHGAGKPVSPGVVCLLLLAGGAAEAGGRVPLTAILSPRGELVGAQNEGTIYLWDRRSGAQRGKILHAAPFRGALTPGGLVAVGGAGLRVLSGALFQHELKVKLPSGAVVGRTAISQDGRVVAATFPREGGAGDPDTVGLWNGRTGAPRQRISLEQGRVLGLLLSGRGDLLVIYGDDPQRGAVLRVYRLQGRSARLVIRSEERGDRTTYGAALDARARRLVLSSGRRLVLWDLARKKVIAQAETSALAALFPPRLRKAGFRMPAAHAVALSPDGKRLSTLHAFGVVGVGLWEVPGRRAAGGARRAPERGSGGGGLRPLQWIKRPEQGGTPGPLAWDRGKLWLLTTEGNRVQVHTPHGDRFRSTRTLTTP